MSARPIITAILTPQGLQDTPYTAYSLADAAPHEPEGVYTVTRTFEGHKTLYLDAHLDRLEDSAQREGIPLHLARGALRAALRQLIARGGYEDTRFRITVPREAPDRLYLALEPQPALPPGAKSQGVRAQTLSIRRMNPRSKTTAWIQQRQAASAEVAPEVYETLLLDEAGYILEGSSSNFYAIQAGTLYTAEEGILSGISRRALLDCLGDLLPLRRDPVHLDDLPALEEAFITSSSRGVVPVVVINGQPIGTGAPGPHTQALSERYDAWTAAHLTPI